MDWISDGWVWLENNNKQIGSLGAIAFGLSGAVVAWMAYKLNFRNNFGWRPMIVIGRYGNDTEKGQGVVQGEIEIWNRRKYPIVAWSVDVEYRQVRFSLEQRLQNDWNVLNDRLISYRNNVRIEPSSFHAFKFRAVYQKDHYAFEEPSIVAWVFDPRLGRLVKLSSKGGSWRSDRIWHGAWKATMGKIRRVPASDL